MAGLSSILGGTLRATARTGGRALFGAQKAWRRRVFAAYLREELSRDYRRWCANFTPPPAASDAARRFLARNFGGYDDIRYHELCWCISGSTDPAFIPADIFYRKIEPTLNQMDYVPVLTDKNALYILPVGPHLPEPVLHVIRGDVYLPGFVRVDDDAVDRILKSSRDAFVLKPSIEHGGGRDLHILDGPGAAAFIKEMLKDRGSRSGVDWLVQRPLDQCAEMARFNPSSVNTYRIMMMRLGRDIACLSGVLRTGRRGMKVDNQAAGGLAGGIECGRLRGRAMDHDLRYYAAHPDSGVAFAGELPAYQLAVELCAKLHQQFPWFDLISWDVAIDAQYQPRIIEFNTASQEINFHQLNNGPLFGPEGGAVFSGLLRRLAAMPLNPDFSTA
jgi:Sugar-transfer associated ATP-grasp